MDLTASSDETPRRLGDYLLLRRLAYGSARSSLMRQFR